MSEKANRKDIVLATKIAGPGDYTKHIRTNGFSKEALFEAVDGSLKRLKTDYIDLFQLHWPERESNFFGKRGFKYIEEDKWSENFENVLQTLKKLIDSGKIRQVGLSNSLLNRLFEVGNAEICMRENTGLLAYSPLGFGVLSGKYLKGNLPEDSRLKLFPNLKRFSGEKSMRATQLYMEIASKNNLSLTQMSLAFVNSQPFVTSNIIGASKLSQLKENIESIKINLSQEVLKEIEEVHERIPNPAP